MQPESAGHQRAPLIEKHTRRLPTVCWPSGPAALLQPCGLQLPAHTEPHQRSPFGRTPRREEEQAGGEYEWEEGAWKEEPLISSWEDAALWCEIVWSCHLSQASLKATLNPVMGLTSVSFHSFMSLFIFCFVTPPPNPTSSSLSFLTQTPFLLSFAFTDIFPISPGCSWKHFNNAVVHQSSLCAEQYSWPSWDEIKIQVVCWRDKDAYLSHYVSGNTDTNRSDEVWIHGEIKVKSHEITLILPEHTEVIILLEITG